MSGNDHQRADTVSRGRKILGEALGLAHSPQRIPVLIAKIARDAVSVRTQQSHLYAFTTARRDTSEALRGIMEWLARAQRPYAGIAAYYSLLTGYSSSYPETTGYIIPTLCDYAKVAGGQKYRDLARDATQWLLGLQLPSGAFPGGFADHEPAPSVFNSGQILQGLVAMHQETAELPVMRAAVGLGDWLAEVQEPDGSWRGPTYQGRAHTYYTMVAWSLAMLANCTQEKKYAQAANRNVDWVMQQQRSSGWFEGINLQGHPTYLHFVAYVIQGMLETGILLNRSDAVECAAKAAWALLRKFELRKHLPGTFEADWKNGGKFACLTGNAQMSCVWLRLYERTGDLRYLNAALKINELLKERVAVSGSRGVRGGVGGSYPSWGAYQPLRFISWGNKFAADALMLEMRLLGKRCAK
jgi:hypothetical protein